MKSLRENADCWDEQKQNKKKKERNEPRPSRDSSKYRKERGGRRSCDDPLDFFGGGMSERHDQASATMGPHCSARTAFAAAI